MKGGIEDDEDRRIETGSELFSKLQKIFVFDSFTEKDDKSKAS